MKSELSEWYRTKFNQLEANPPKEIWGNISNELDIEEVWQNVNLELKKKSRRKLILINAFYLLTALLLFGTGTLFFYYQTDLIEHHSISQYPGNYSNHTVFNKTNYSSHLEVDNIDKTRTGQKNKITSLLEVNNNNDKKTVHHHNSLVSSDPSQKIKLLPKDFVNESPKHLNSKQKKNTKHFLKNTNPDLISSKNTSSSTYGIIKQNISDSIVIPNYPSFPLSAIVPVQVFLPEKKDSAVSFIELAYLPNNAPLKCLIIGTSFTYTNSWLLNNDTYDGFNKNNLNQTNLSFGNAYALLIGYDLSNKYTLQTEWSINNKQEQNYVRYNEGKQMQKKIEINYTHFNLLVKKKEMRFLFSNRIPVSLNYIAGIQYGHIKSVFRTFNDKTRLITDRYRKNNYSLVLGVEYQFSVKQLCVISAGLRTDIGLLNIYAGNGTIPASFNRTYNSSIGLNIGINYCIPMKRRK
ncbi:MAG: hypothetical protein Q8L90_08905 [Bacteroidota bacterium]|nr:hypothetical protein [Bacteroidota bacterium]